MAKRLGNRPLANNHSFTPTSTLSPLDVDNLLSLTTPEFNSTRADYENAKREWFYDSRGWLSGNRACHPTETG
ncbi:MAG: hypothetical protein ABI378_05385 [Chitinophagaceae bacterium]